MSLLRVQLPAGVSRVRTADRALHHMLTSLNLTDVSAFSWKVLTCLALRKPAVGSSPFSHCASLQQVFVQLETCVIGKCFVF